MSLNRWREYIRAFHPRLKLGRVLTDTCNVCYRIDTELKSSHLTAELEHELEQHRKADLNQAKSQRLAMNEAVKKYQAAWAPDQPLVDACPLELETDDDLWNQETIPDEPDKEHVEALKVLVQCEDYGPAIPLSSCKARTPNMEHFNNDLHLHNFNLCNITNGVNKILLYDERDAGKNSNTLCSLRWYSHTQAIKKLLEDDIQPPSMLIKVMDNREGQNKSQTTEMFSSLLSLLLYDRVADLFLLPGCSHMKADQVGGNCKKSLAKQNIYVPSQVSDAYNSVPSMNAEVITGDSGVFVKWDGFLKKHMQPLPPGFTSCYCFEFHDGEVIYKPNVGSMLGQSRRLQTNIDATLILPITQDSDELICHHKYVTDPEATRKAILYELLRLPATATIQDIVSAKLHLPILKAKPLSKTKLDFIARKKPSIPEEYHSYYSGREPAQQADEDEPPENQMKRKTKKAAGRPKKRREEQPEQSIFDFMLPRSTQSRGIDIGLFLDIVLSNP